MNRLKRKFFPAKKVKAKVEEELYLAPNYDEKTNIAVHLQTIADELLSIAKKSSHTIRLAKLHDELIRLKEEIVVKLSAPKKVDGTSDASLADSTSCLSVWSPNSSILSSSVPTPTFRRRLAESSILETNYSSVIQEHFLSVYQQLCSSCSACQCYQVYIRDEMQTEYLVICSLNEQLKNENDLLQRLLADCKYSYEQQYVSFCQYEQYLIDYERCLENQQQLIEHFQQLVDRLQRKRDDDETHIYQKISDLDFDQIELQRTIGKLADQCEKQVECLPKRPQLFSYSHDQFRPPANISGLVEVADLEVAILLVDLLAFKHENHRIRWENARRRQENHVLQAKVDVFELTNRYFQNDSESVNEPTADQLREREKTLRLYVSRLYQLLQMTSEELRQRDDYYETLVYQLKKRQRDLQDALQRFKDIR